MKEKRGEVGIEHIFVISIPLIFMLGFLLFKQNVYSVIEHKMNNNNATQVENSEPSYYNDENDNSIDNDVSVNIQGDNNTVNVNQTINIYNK